MSCCCASLAMRLLVLFGLVLFGSCRVAKNESDVGFPEHEKVDLDRNNTRVPLFIPGRCKENELLYPGDNNNDWICDCGPGFVYYRPKDGCFAVYRKGPCNEGEYLMLKKGDFTPFCEANPCGQDGFVLYNNVCYKLFKPGKPCEPVEEGGGIFGVNSTTLELDCLKGTDRLSILPPRPNCPPGMKLDRIGSCRRIVE